MNDGFATRKKRSIIREQNNKVIKNNELEVNKVKYRSQTTPREEFEKTGYGCGWVKFLTFMWW